MTELLRDPVWQFAGAVLTIFAIVVSVAIYYAQRVKRNLSFEVLHNERLLTITEESVGNLQLVFDGIPVQNARLIQVAITNAGNQAITPIDFVRPLTISLNEGAAILSAVVLETQPSNLLAEINVDGNMVEVVPLLLNPKDFFIIKLLASEYQSGPIANARINGVSKITEVRQRLLWDLIVILVCNICMISAIVLVREGVSRPPLSERIAKLTSNELLSVGLLTVALIGSTWVAVRLYKRYKRVKQSIQRI